jgi:hypothetical protein
VSVFFEGLKSIGYISSAPVGHEVRPESFELVDRGLVVVRSGSAGLGAWHREASDVTRDYRCLFGENADRVKWLGLESHSDDVAGQTEVLFGGIWFEGR